MANFKIFVAFAVIIATASAFYDSADEVVKLNKKNFEQLVETSDRVWIVQFYAKWCIPSAELVDEFKKTAKALKGAVNVGVVNCDTDRVIAKKYDVTEVPTIMFFSDEFSFPYHEERSARALAETGLAEVYTKVKYQLKNAQTSDEVKPSNNQTASAI